jgi:periplasmic divalent cation tolerance protein
LIASTQENSGSDDDFGAVIVLTTLGADADAAALGRILVEERLAACVNVLPVMTSIYRWKGRVETDREQQLVIKTTRTQAAALEQRLRELHPYELPEFLVLPASGGSEAYLRWVGESTGSRGPG